MNDVRWIDGIKYTRYYNPAGGRSYYADAGPEGAILAMNNALIPSSHHLALAIWDMEASTTSGPKPPHLDFNKTGFRT